MKVYLGRRPCVHPAQGNALGWMDGVDFVSAQRANGSPSNRWSVGPIRRKYGVLTRISHSPTS